MRDILILSNSEKKAIKRDIAILDRYATRINNNAWTTKITDNGIEVLLSHLKNNATKQTSISILFRTPTGFREKYHIGKKDFRNDIGGIPVHTHKIKKYKIPKDYIKIGTIINRIVGLLHDFGKANVDFQNKLHDRNSSDLIRHELISLYIFNLLEKDNNITLNDIVNKFNIIKNDNTLLDFINKGNGLNNHFDLIKYLILTHHKMPSNDENNINISPLDLKNYKKELKDDFKINFHPKTIEILGPIFEDAKKLLRRLDNINEEPNYWFGLSYLCRSTFILADHIISSQIFYRNNKIEVNAENADSNLFANTYKDLDLNKVYYNQELNYHLRKVSSLSSQLLYEFSINQFSGLSEHKKELLTTKTSHKKYIWQNKVLSHLNKINLPTLVVNTAGTGSGKTKTNVLALASLAKENKLRFSTVLNLKTLTLQTIDQYKASFSFDDSEICGVIGDKVATKLHYLNKDYEDQTINENVENFNKEEEDYDNDLEFEISSKTLTKNIPYFIKKILNKRNLTNILSAPVTVTTIDFLINAGDLTRQGHFANAFLRSLNSDLIIDEIDSYENESIISVARLVMTYAMSGRNVVISSATISDPILNLIYEAFHFGQEIYSALNRKRIKYNVAFINNLIDPNIISNVDLQNHSITDFYSEYMSQILTKLETLPPTKKFKVADFKTKTFDEYFNVISQNIQNLHDQFKYSVNGKKISFGLVRVANIEQAVQISKNLLSDKSLENKIKLSCYHSQLTTIHRSNIEKNLEMLLNRSHNIRDNINKNDEIKAILTEKQDEFIFVIVATPVIEIGRDLDFDWCICEPSSVQSIIQTAGRVNRHREEQINKENVVILEYNYRHIKNPNQPCFCKPGYDGYQTPHSIHTYADTVKKLNNGSISMNFLLKSHGDLNIKLKFEKNPQDLKEFYNFARLDHAFLKAKLNNYNNYFKKKTIKIFFNNLFYKKTKLRDSVFNYWLTVQNNKVYLLEDKNINKKVLINNQIELNKNKNMLFLNYQNLKNTEIDPLFLNSVIINGYQKNDYKILTNYIYDINFGFYKKLLLL